MGHRVQTGQRPQAAKQPPGRKAAAAKGERSGGPVVMVVLLLVLIVACGAVVGRMVLGGSKPKEVDRSTLVAPGNSPNAPGGAMFDPAKMPRKGARGAAPGG